MLAAGCGGHPASSPVLARVGDSQLTLADARQHVDTARADAAGQINRYVAAWVNGELLYQEAKRKGVDRAEPVQRAANEALRQIVVQEYLRESLFGDTSGVPEDSLRGYYARHAAEFFVHEDMIGANLAIFAGRERASAFAAAISQGTAWSPALRDSVYSASLLTGSAGSIFTVHTIVPPELWRVCQGLGAGEVSYPVKTDAGYAVVQVIRTYKQGAPASFEIARDEILQRSLIVYRQQRYDSLLSGLRARAQIQINSSITLSDTVPHHE